MPSQKHCIFWRALSHPVRVTWLSHKNSPVSRKSTVDPRKTTKRTRSIIITQRILYSLPFCTFFERVLHIQSKQHYILSKERYKSATFCQKSSTYLEEPFCILYVWHRRDSFTRIALCLERVIHSRSKQHYIPSKVHQIRSKQAICILLKEQFTFY